MYRITGSAGLGQRLRRGQAAWERDGDVHHDGQRRWSIELPPQSVATGGGSLSATRPLLGAGPQATGLGRAMPTILAGNARTGREEIAMAEACFRLLPVPEETRDA